MIKLKDGVAAVRDALSGGGVQPSAPTNTPVTLASDGEPPKRPDGEYDGEMPKSNALVSDRARVLADIAERRNAQVVANAEEGNSVYNGTAADPDAETAPPAGEVEGADLEGGEPEQPATAPAAPVVQAAPAGPEETRTIIVDGQAMQVPVSKIIERGTATLQKEVAADSRLAEANRLLEQAQRIAAQAAPQKDAEETDVDPIAKMSPADRIKVIRYGTDEDAAKVQEYIERQASQPKVSKEELIREARAAVAPQIAFEDGRKYVIAEYGDLLQDPDLGAIFLNRETSARNSGDTRPFAELYKAIGDEMRTKFNRPKPGAQGAAQPTPAPVASTTQARTMAEKQEAKAAAPSLPRLASARLDGDANTPRPPTRAEIIDQARRARGFSQGKNF